MAPVHGFSEVRLSVLPEYGRGTLWSAWLGNGMNLCELHTMGAVDHVVARSELFADAFKFTFHLDRWPLAAGIEGLKRKLLLQRGDSYILSPHAIGVHDMKKRNGYREFNLFVPPLRMTALLEDGMGTFPGEVEKILRNSEGDIFLHQGFMDPGMYLTIAQIHACPFTGSLRGVYLEAKSLELLVLRMHTVLAAPLREATPVKLSRRDLDRVRDAGLVLAQSFQEPPSLGTLAHTVGLNTTKLKYSFKRQFGTTVFGYLHRFRMAQALDLLRDTDLDVSEISYRVGYGSHSAFSAAFKREFGRRPRDLRKRG
jgi:AraC-like DNA-binding protein